MTLDSETRLRESLRRLAAAVPDGPRAINASPPSVRNAWRGSPTQAVVLLVLVIAGAIALRESSPFNAGMAKPSPSGQPSGGSAEPTDVSQATAKNSAIPGRLFEADVAVSGAAIAMVAVIDETGLVQGVAPASDFRMTSDEYAKYSLRNMLVLPVPNSDDLYVLWSTGVCQPNQRVIVSGTAAGVNIAVDEGPLATSPCDLMGSGITIRLRLSTAIDYPSIKFSRT